MNRGVLFRIAVDAALAVCIFFGWWYIALPIGIIALFRFSYFAEFIAAGFAYDALFGMGAGVGLISAYAGTLVAAILSGIAALLRGSMR